MQAPTASSSGVNVSLLFNLAAAAKKVLVVAAERVFSLLKSSFGCQQDSSLKDYVH